MTVAICGWPDKKLNAATGLRYGLEACCCWCGQFCGYAEDASDGLMDLTDEFTTQIALGNTRFWNDGLTDLSGSDLINMLL